MRAVEYCYYRDARNNYLVIPCPEDKGQGSYQYRMLAANSIPGILPCALRYVDGKGYLYYEITSRQALGRLYEDRTIERKQAKEVLRNLAEAQLRLGSYLLDASGIIADPFLTFYDFASGKCSFVYYPEERQEEEGTGIFRFLAEHLSASTEEEEGFQSRLEELDRLSRDRNFLLTDDMLAYVLNGPPEPEPDAEDDGEKHKEEDAERTLRMEWEERAPEEETEELYSLKQGDKKGTGDKKIRFGKSILLFALAVCCLVSGTVLQWMRLRQMFLPQVDIVVRWSIPALLLLSLIFAALGIMSGYRTEKKKHKEEDLLSAQEEENRMIPAVEFRGELSSEPEDRSFAERLIRNSGYSGKLYGQGSSRQTRIDLRRLPCTVGTDRRFADAVIAEDSVSRLHARFERIPEEEKQEEGGTPGAIRVMDLNSRNGTFVNGRRLLPNEAAILIPGDECRFGSEEFVYR